MKTTNEFVHLDLVLKNNFSAIFHMPNRKTCAAKREKSEKSVSNIFLFLKRIFMYSLSRSAKRENSKKKKIEIKFANRFTILSTKEILAILLAKLSAFFCSFPATYADLNTFIIMQDYLRQFWTGGQQLEGCGRGRVSPSITINTHSY